MHKCCHAFFFVSPTVSFSHSFQALAHGSRCSLRSLSTHTILGFYDKKVMHKVSEGSVPKPWSNSRAGISSGSGVHHADPSGVESRSCSMENDAGPGPFLMLTQSQVSRAWGKAVFVFAAFPGPAEVWGECPNTHSIQHSCPSVKLLSLFKGRLQKDEKCLQKKVTEELCKSARKQQAALGVGKSRSCLYFPSAAASHRALTWEGAAKAMPAKMTTCCLWKVSLFPYKVILKGKHFTSNLGDWRGIIFRLAIACESEQCSAFAWVYPLEECSQPVSNLGLWQGSAVCRRAGWEPS